MLLTLKEAEIRSERETRVSHPGTTPSIAVDFRYRLAG